MNLQQINQINNIIFTPREIDVIACIINVRGVKKLLIFLVYHTERLRGI
jgi:hypothetical protein